MADFFWLIAGPATSRVLADFGADVIKIESRSRMDNIRTAGPQPTSRAASTPTRVFNDVNTNKRSVNLNLRSPRGVELAKEIVRHSDIVTNNFTGDRMDRWGLGYEALREVRPDLIMLTMPVMGTTGPYIRYGAYGNGVIGFGGMRTNMGFPGRPPVGIAPLYSDFSAPYFAVGALMAALYHREQTGEGQFIDLAQAESAVSLLGTDVLEYTANGRVPAPPGNRAPDYAPHGAYAAGAPTAGWRSPCARTPSGARCAARWPCPPSPTTRASPARRPQAPRGRARRGDRGVDREHDAWQVMHVLQAGGVMAGVVEDLEDMLVRDPHLPRAPLRAPEARRRGHGLHDPPPAGAPGWPVGAAAPGAAHGRAQ